LLAVDKKNFEEEVLQFKGVAVVDFWSQKCEPCKALMPEVEELAAKYEGKAKFCKLDTGGNRRLAISQKVMGLPTIAFYKDGEGEGYMTLTSFFIICWCRQGGIGVYLEREKGIASAGRGTR
jgi:thioredoxin 1